MAERTIEDILGELDTKKAGLQKQRLTDLVDALGRSSAPAPEGNMEKTLGRIIATSLPVAIAAAFGGKRAAGLAAGPAAESLTNLSKKDELNAERERKAAQVLAVQLGKQISDVDKQRLDFERLRLGPELARKKAEATFDTDLKLKEAGKTNITLQNIPPSTAGLDVSASPTIRAQDGAAPTKGDIKEATKLSKFGVSQVQAVDELRDLYANGLTQDTFTGEQAQRAQQLLNVIKDNNVQLSGRGANLTRPELNLVEGMVGVISGKEDPLSAFKTVLKELIGDDPVTAIDHFKLDFRKRLENGLKANKHQLNFRDPDVALMFSEGSLLTGQGSRSRKEVMETLTDLYDLSIRSGDNHPTAKAERRLLKRKLIELDRSTSGR